MRSMMTFSSSCAFNASRFGRRRAICMTNGAEGGGGGISQPTCEKCGTLIVRCENFCSDCGHPVPEANKIAHPQVSSNLLNVRLSFGYSTSNHYSWAVDICKKIPSYSETGEGKKIRHEVTLPITDMGLALTIYHLVGTWRSASMHVGNIRADRGDLNGRGGLCYRQWQRAYSPENYCFGENMFENNIWGCKSLHMPHELSGGWLKDGHMDDQGVWHFHKEKIRHDLGMKAENCKFCPVFDLKRVSQILDKIPDCVNPRVDPEWEYVTRAEETGEYGNYREIKVGVRLAPRK